MKRRSEPFLEYLREPYLIQKFHERRNNERTYFGKIAAFLSTIAYLYAMYQDNFILDFSNLLVVRLAGFFFTLVYLVFSFTKWTSNRTLHRVVYDMFLLSSIIHLCVVIIFANFSSGAIGALIMSVFAIAIIYRGAPLDLGLIFALPIAGLILIIILFVHPDPEHWTLLANPIALSIVAWAVGWFQERTRYREFRWHWIADTELLVSKELLDKVDSEMKLAAKIQSSLIPQVSPQIAGLSFAMFYKPMDEVGGDFFDFIDVDNKKGLGVFMSDVSGHGVPASLISSMVKTLVTTSSKDIISPSEFLQEINQKICGLSAGNFVAAFYGIYFHKTRKFVYSTATQTFPYILRETFVLQMRGRGSMLGMFPNLNFDVYEFQCEPGDRILFYTDGLIETFNKDNEVFQKVIDKAMLAHRDEDIRAFLTSVFDELNRFAGGCFNDDICMVAMDIE
ncbi:MAG: serine/threonine-protein phosphatase [Brevinematales bacterium]|nr:serine/threonine-protein phosphatase [Brevinematales bacterium]